MRLLITGGCGFIGSHCINHALLRSDIRRVVNLDALTYSGHIENNPSSSDDKFRFIHGSINDESLLKKIFDEEDIDVVLHLAAESHVDRSIQTVEPFIQTNIDGTRSILEAIRNRFVDNGKVVHLVHISTDEVYGSLAPSDPPFVEDTPLDPRNPYAVSKAASDMLVRSFVNTHGVSSVITRCSNNYGPRQFPEKLIPLMVLRALNNESLPVYGDGKQVRDWIHVSDHVRGVFCAMDGLVSRTFESGEVFNFGASNEIENIEIVRMIVGLTNASEDLISFVTDRPGHDRRYAMGFKKSNEILGWKPLISWKSGLESTVDWYISNRAWVKSITSGDYLKWIESKYGD